MEFKERLAELLKIEIDIQDVLIKMKNRNEPNELVSAIFDSYIDAYKNRIAYQMAIDLDTSLIQKFVDEGKNDN